MNFYNEFDPKAAATLRELIALGLIPAGVVDERSITELQPHDLSGYTQCHFFAGVGGWALGLRLAGFPDDRPIWTASLPCQPFSTAGKQAGTEDERHLWPVFERLVRACKPPVVLGEQVASKLARVDWLPGVCLDLEALGYEFGAVDLSSPCAGEVGEGRILRGDSDTWERVIFGKPHIRQRLYWVAACRVANPDQRGGEVRCEVPQPDDSQYGSAPDSDRLLFDGACGLADAHRVVELRELRSGDEGTGPCGEPLGRGLLQAGSDGSHPDHRMADSEGRGLGIDGSTSRGAGHADECGEVDADRGLFDDDRGLADTECDEEHEEQRGPTATEGRGCPDVSSRRSMDSRLGDTGGERPQGHAGDESDRSEPGRECPQPAGPTGSAGWTLLPCRDGKTRRTQSGIFPLVNGLPRGVVPSGDPSSPEYANSTAEARAARLKGYGNAIQIDTAVLFIRSYLGARP